MKKEKTVRNMLSKLKKEREKEKSEEEKKELKTDVYHLEGGFDLEEEEVNVGELEERLWEERMIELRKRQREEIKKAEEELRAEGRKRRDLMWRIVDQEEEEKKEKEEKKLFGDWGEEEIVLERMEGVRILGRKDWSGVPERKKENVLEEMAEEEEKMKVKEEENEKNEEEKEEEEEVWLEVEDWIEGLFESDEDIKKRMEKEQEKGLWNWIREWGNWLLGYKKDT